MQALVLLRYWRQGLIGLGAAILLGLFAVQYIGRLRAERSLAQCQTQNARLSSAIERQNAAVRRMHDEGEARAAEQREALARARRENAAQAPLIDRLRRAASRPQTAPGCATPPELREMGNML